MGLYFHCHHILDVTQHKIRSVNGTAVDDITVKPACLWSKAVKWVKCAFPLWLPNNRYTSFTLIKIKSLLPLPFLYTSTSFLSSSVVPPLNSPSSLSTLILLSLPLSFSPCPLASLIVSLSLSSGTFLTPRHVSFVSLYPPACAVRRQNIAWENEGEHKAAVCSLPVNPVMIYVHSVSRYLAITPGSHELGRW